MFANTIKSCYAIITKQCNLRCPYCYVKHKESSDYIMDMTTIDNIVKSFQCDKPEIVFFGGEPLLRLDFIKEVVDKYKDKCIFQTVSNGTINIKEFVEFYKPLKDSIFKFQLSWDGNTNTRVNANQDSLSTLIYNNILYILNEGCWFEGRGVISDTNVNDFHKTYLDICDLKKTYPNQVGYDFTIAYQDSYLDSFPSNLETQLDLVFKEIAKDVRKAFIPRFLLQYLYKYHSRQPLQTHCAIDKEIYVEWNGDVFVCDMFSNSDTPEKFCLGNVNTSFTTLNPDHIKPCSEDCKLRNICSGGCPAKKYFRDNTLCKGVCGYHKVLYDCMKRFVDNLSFQDSLDLFKRVVDNYKWYMSENGTL